jgi:hypothetical protein
MQVMSGGRIASRLACLLLAGLPVARGILEEVAVGVLEAEAAGAGVLDAAPAAHPDTTAAVRTSTAASAGRRLVSDDFMATSLPGW